MVVISVAIGRDFFFLKRINAADIGETVLELCARRLPATYGYSPVLDIQVLCPSKKGDCGTVNLNNRLQALLNPPAEDKKELNSLGRILREGDKVMQVKNNYNLEWKRGREEGAGVFNGDVGIILKIDKRAGTHTR